VGEHDLDAMKEQASVLGSRVPGARVVTVPGGGHMLNLTSPDAFRKAVSTFLSR
jgi:pimeloyl-ACP methyl ester carboxylesterase